MQVTKVQTCLFRSLKDLRREVRKAVKHYNTKRPHNSLARRTPANFEEEILNSVDQKRPTVNIYTEGYPKIKEAKRLFDLGPKEGLGAHICPMVY